ncbi:MAG: transposase [Deltaproteobacteria bacterium]|nr:transposase [Deltaproteobacteria bacterium]
MARPLRLAYENATYHITARGNRRENIFYSDKDKSVFLEKMNETFNKYSFTCYAYCLMDNHYHLFIKTPHANISEGMHYLNASYTNWFKAEHKIVGVIFQGRYKSILVDEDSYGLKLSAYIHLNPLRARVVDDLYEYKWSSFLDYVRKRKSIAGLSAEFILRQFDEDIEKARRRYKRFVLENIDMDNPLGDSYRGMAIGSEEFVERIKEKIKSLGIKREVTETKIAGTCSAEEVIKSIMRRFGVNRQEIFRKRRGNIYRQLALYFIKRYTMLSLKEIGEEFDMDYAAVSQSCKRFEELVKRDRSALRMKAAIEKELN